MTTTQETKKEQVKQEIKSVQEKNAMDFQAILDGTARNTTTSCKK